MMNDELMFRCFIMIFVISVFGIGLFAAILLRIKRLYPDIYQSFRIVTPWSIVTGTAKREDMYVLIPAEGRIFMFMHSRRRRQLNDRILNRLIYLYTALFITCGVILAYAAYPIIRHWYYIFSNGEFGNFPIKTVNTTFSTDAPPILFFPLIFGIGYSVFYLIRNFTKKKTLLQMRNDGIDLEKDLYITESLKVLFGKKDILDYRLTKTGYLKYYIRSDILCVFFFTLFIISIIIFMIINVSRSFL